MGWANLLSGFIYCTTFKHRNVPAHVVEIQVLDIKDGEGERIDHIFAHFQGLRPVKRVIDLRLSNVAAGAINDEESAMEADPIDTGVESEISREEEENSLEELKEEGDEGQWTV